MSLKCVYVPFLGSLFFFFFNVLFFSLGFQHDRFSFFFILHTAFLVSQYSPMEADPITFGNARQRQIEWKSRITYKNERNCRRFLRWKLHLNGEKERKKWRKNMFGKRIRFPLRLNKAFRWSCASITNTHIQCVCVCL